MKRKWCVFKEKGINPYWERRSSMVLGHRYSRVYVNRHFGDSMIANYLNGIFVDAVKTYE